MDKVINFGIPHVSEQIFEHIETHGLIKCLEVSETWKVLAENVLIKRRPTEMKEPKEPKRSQRSSSKNRKFLAP